MQGTFALRLSTALLSVALAACEGGRSPAPDLPSRGPDPVLKQCVLDSPHLRIGEGLDAPGRLEFDVSAATPGGPCANNTAFRFGSGLYDITGVVANTSGMGWENPQQVFSGLHTRLYSRAYAFASPCNGQRLIFISADIGILWPGLRQAVLEGIAEDESLAGLYGPENVMFSVTHTHSGPAGYSHDDGGNLFHYGFDALVYQTIIDGMLASIRAAHANLEAHPDSAPIRLAVGELLNTNINRSRPAFAMNPEAERREFLNQRGEEIDVDKRVVQLNLLRDNGSPVGMIHWFGVHPTTVGPTLTMVSSDNKGFASLGFERLMGTDYLAPPGQDSFVAAFAQADEGDASPNIFYEQFAHPDPARGGGRDDFESNAISGTKQLASALALYPDGAPLRGPIDYRFFHIPISDITVDDPVVLASLRHPEELDAEVKRTCDGALGVSFGAGAEDGPGPTVEGASCDDDPDYLQSAFDDSEVLLSTTLAGFPGSWPAGAIPPHAASAAAMCNLQDLGFTGDFECQAEKPVFLPSGPDVLPIQLFRIGNFALLGLPWEVTTMSARRIRALMLEELAPAGVDTLVIAGLVNDYVNYLTTREEFASQQYEGASTLYGPWTQAVVAQESLKLARAMRLGAPAPEGVERAATSPGTARPPYTPSDTPGDGGLPGALVSDVPVSAQPGDVVSAEFQAGHPRNDMRIQASYAYAEREIGPDEWETVAHDRDPELLFVWKPLNPSPLPIDPAVVGASTAQIIWQLPRNLPAGRYRLRHEGAWQASELLGPEPYVGTSSTFDVSEPASACP